MFSSLQRGKVLEKYIYLDNKYLLLSDGTGFFSSKKIHCPNCCVKSHKDGSKTYYHQMLGAAIVHPEHKEVIPICPEPIKKEDGFKKNDCERNASERLLRDFRREHPHLPVIIAEDALASNGPHIKLLKELKMSFITVVKPDGNKALFEYVDGFVWDSAEKRVPEQGETSFTDESGTLRRFRWVNNAPLNDSHPDLKVNFFEYWEVDSNGKTSYHNTWITDIPITEENVYKLTCGGRARWKIENETFNTLKNQGYHFEHNFGHGYENLSTVMGMLMMLAFLVDQAEELCCKQFQSALEAESSRRSYLWHHIRSLFLTHIIESWAALYTAIIAGDKRIKPRLVSSNLKPRLDSPPPKPRFDSS